MDCRAVHWQRRIYKPGRRDGGTDRQTGCIGEMMNSARIKEVSDATVYIESHLDQSLSVAELSNMVGLSIFHFQRLFFSGVGENVSEYIRRRRLEKSAKILLEDSQRSIIDVALDCGFQTHSAFSRAFKAQFGHSPSEFRANVDQGTPESETTRRPFLLPMRSKRLAITADVVELPPLWLMYREQQGVVNGSYFPDAQRLVKEFAELTQYAGEDMWAYCGAYRGGPAAFTDDSAIGCYGGLFSQQPGTQWSELCEPLCAGTWAVFPHYGDFEYLYLTWNKLILNWLPASDFQLRDSWAFETYLAQPGKIAPQQASAQIYLPVNLGK